MKLLILFLYFFIGLYKNANAGHFVKESAEYSKHKVNHILEKISDNIKPPNDFFLNGSKIAEDIFRVLQSSRNDVDRYLIGGSIGKGSAIGKQPDFDMVVFLKNKEPPFHRILEEFKEILGNRANGLENYQFRRITNMLVRIKVANMKFDVLPTASYNSHNTSQFEEGLRKFRELQDPVLQCPMHSNTVSEAGVLFMEKQTEFSRAVIRLAKYWNNQIYISEFLQGRSFLIELIALKSSEGVPENNIYVAFKQFLFTMENFERMVVYFEDLYNQSDIPEFILKYRGPIVISPISYYSNLAHHWNLPQSVVLKFKTIAKISLQNMENWILDPFGNEKSFNTIFCKNIFSKLCIENNFPVEDHYLVKDLGTCDNENYFMSN